MQGGHHLGGSKAIKTFFLSSLFFLLSTLFSPFSYYSFSFSLIPLSPLLSSLLFLHSFLSLGRISSRKGVKSKSPEKMTVEAASVLMAHEADIKESEWSF